MSGLYNMIFGYNPLARVLLGLFGIDIKTCGRFRDFYLYKPDGQDMCALLVTRNGGPNRAEYAGENLMLSKMRGYIRDEDAPIDNTYALFYFKLPEESINPLNCIAESSPEFVVTDTFDDRWQKVLRSMEEGSPNEDAQRGMIAISPVLKKAIEQLDNGNPVAIFDSDKK